MSAEYLEKGASTAARVRLILSPTRFQRLDLERHSSCRYDHVAAFEGARVTNASAEIGRYCGAHGAAPPVLKSAGRVMALQFKTDGSVAATG